MSKAAETERDVWTLPPGDSARGKELYREICAACHSLDPSGRHASGPNLWGVWGREANTAPGYRFAASDEKKGIVWQDKTLWDYFDRGHIPGTKMFFRLLHTNHGKRADMLAYLKQASAPTSSTSN